MIFVTLGDKMSKLHELEIEYKLAQLHVERIEREWNGAARTRDDKLKELMDYDEDFDGGYCSNADRMRVGEVSKGYAPSRRHGAT